MSSPSTASLKTFQFPEVRVVEASAGSGKTYALAKRYIQLLLNPALDLEQIPIRNILAITFTNKASFEMKARILEFLKAIALGQLPVQEEEEILKPIGVKQEDARKKAFMIMDDLIRNYNFFQVQTIDKFINALLSGCAFKIGLTANFKIKTNSDDYLQYSLDELIDRAPNDKNIRRVFEYFLHNYLYLENRTGWFPKQDILSIVSALFAQHNSYGLMFREGPYHPDDIIKKKKTILTEIKNLSEILPEATDKRFLKALDKFLSNHSDGFDIDSVSDYFAREFVPVRKGAEVSKELEKTWKKIRTNLTELCDKEAYSLFNPYIEVFDMVLDGLHQLAAKDDVLFLSELNKKAGSLFDQDYVTVEELYYRLATRFRHYLIDEFQDTSRLQWHNIEKMAEEALSTGGSLFYVGDRKQAIYGFRGGEVELFDDIKQEFQAFNVVPEFLTRNWRSQKAVVDFNNEVFSVENIKAMIAAKQNYEDEKNKKGAVFFNEEDIKDVENIFSSSQQTFQEKHDRGFVKMEYIDIDKKEDRDEYVRERLLDLIADLRKRFSLGDIAILTRSNSQVEQLTNWLLEQNIQVDSERTSNIKENVLIDELVSFLKFLNSPIDNVSFTNFILGQTFAKATGKDPQEMHDFVFSLREQLTKQSDFYIYTEFRKKYEDVWNDLISEFFQNVGLYPLYELMVSIYSKFKILDNFPEYQGFLMHFLEVIKKEEEDHADITSFLQYFEELEGEGLYVNVTDTHAVKILTTHKSKGLEFPVVIVPFLGMDIQVGAQGDNSQSYISLQSGSSMELLRLKKKYLRFSEDLSQIYRQEYKKAFLSELNNIYVALTRAQNELYGFIPKRIVNSFNFVKFLIPEEIYEVGQPHNYEIQEKEKDSYLQIPCSQYHDWIQYLKEEFHDIDLLRNREQRLKGEVVHFMLSFIGDLNQKDLKVSINEACERAGYQFPHIDSLDEHAAVIENLLKKKELKDFFYIEKGEVFTEKDIVNHAGITKRLDRLIVKDDEVWIVDYKSSELETGEYQTQVKEYIDIVAKIYPKKRIRGFLVYLDQIRLEEV